MKTKINQIKRKQIIDFFLAHNFDRKVTRNHFKTQGFGERFIDRTLEQYNRTGSVDYSQTSGRIPKVCTSGNAAKLKRLLIKDPSLSNREASKKLGISKSSVHQLKKKTGIITRTKSSAPLYKNDQAERAKRGCKKLYKQLVNSGGGKFVIMDDETYVPYDYKQIPCKEFWNDIPGVEIPANSKVKRKEKVSGKFSYLASDFTRRKHQRAIHYQAKFEWRNIPKGRPARSFFKFFQREKRKLLF